MNHAIMAGCAQIKTGQNDSNKKQAKNDCKRTKKLHQPDGAFFI